MDGFIPSADANAKDTANVRRVKELYAALHAKDRAALRGLLAAEPVWDVSPGFPEGGVYTGMPEVFGRFYPRLIAHVHSFGALPEAFVDGGDTVVALGHYRVQAKEDAETVLVRFAHAWRFDAEGRIAGVWQVADSASFPQHSQ